MQNANLVLMEGDFSAQKCYMDTYEAENRTVHLG